MSSSEGPTQDTTGVFKPENQKYALRHILHKMDKSVSDTPFTAVKYLTNNPDVESLSWNDRADFEYFLLNYNVDKNSETASNVMSLQKMLASRSLSAGFDWKKDGMSGTLTKVVSLVIVSCIIWLIISILVLIVMFFLQSIRGKRPFEQFMVSFFLALIVVAIFVVFYNMIIVRIASTQETL